MPLSVFMLFNRYNEVTIDIIEGIMQACSDYFANFAPTVLRVILTYAEAMLTQVLVVRVHRLVRGTGGI